MTSVLDAFEVAMGGSGSYLRIPQQPGWLNGMLRSSLAPVDSLSPDCELDSVLEDSDVPRRVFHGLVNRWTVNGKASLKGHVYLIGVWAGVPLAMTEIFAALLASPKLFPDVVTSREEQNITTIGFAQFIDYGNVSATLLPSGVPLIPRLFPRDPGRQILSAFLSLLACDFITQHEWFHVLGGHLDYLKLHTNYATLTEFDGNEQRGTSLLTRQALEADADRLASHRVASQAKDLSSRHGAPPFFGEPTMLFRSLTFLVGVLFGVLSRFGQIYEPNVPSTHLGCRTRCRLAIQQMTEELTDRHGMDAATLEQGRILGLQDLRVAAEIMEGIIPVFNDGDVLFQQELDGLREVLNKLEEIYSMLRSWREFRVWRLIPT